jgi:hypothetical protein
MSLAGKRQAGQTTVHDGLHLLAVPAGPRRADELAALVPERAWQWR